MCFFVEKDFIIVSLGEFGGLKWPASMESTLFTEISDSKQRIARISNEGKAKSSSGQKTVDPSQYQDSYTYDDIYKVWMGDVQKQETGSLIKSSFMVFEIRTVRQVDEETVSVWKRYKELYAWYVAVS